MPYIGPWGTFIHIPKTGGTFVRKALFAIPQKTNDKNINRGLKTHDLPMFYQDGEVWTSVREPVEWLASVWGWMERTSWRRYPHQVPWHSFVDYIIEHKDKWPKFIKNMMTKTPGVVGWFYGMYTPPGVNAYKLGPELYQKLRDIGGNPDVLGTKINSNQAGNKPIITDEQRIMVYNAERACYDRYGFEPPDCLKEK